MKKVIIFILVVFITACSSPKVEEKCCIDSTKIDSTLVIPIDSTKKIDSITVDSTKK